MQGLKQQLVQQVLQQMLQQQMWRQQLLWQKQQTLKATLQETLRQVVALVMWGFSSNSSNSAFTRCSKQVAEGTFCTVILVNFGNENLFVEWRAALPPEQQEQQQQQKQQPAFPGNVVTGFVAASYAAFLLALSSLTVSQLHFVMKRVVLQQQHQRQQADPRSFISMKGETTSDASAKAVSRLTANAAAARPAIAAKCTARVSSVGVAVRQPQQVQQQQKNEQQQHQEPHAPLVDAHVHGCVALSRHFACASQQPLHEQHKQKQQQRQGRTGGQQPERCAVSVVSGSGLKSAPRIFAAAALLLPLFCLPATTPAEAAAVSTLAELPSARLVLAKTAAGAAAAEGERFCQAYGGLAAESLIFAAATRSTRPSSAAVVLNAAADSGARAFTVAKGGQNNSREHSLLQAQQKPQQDSEEEQSAASADSAATAGGEAACEPWLSSGETPVCLLQFPLSADNAAAVALIAVLCVFGIIHLMRISAGFIKGCQCRLCKGDYTLVRKLGRGGYGTVWLARLRRRAAAESSATPFVVLKKIAVADITAADSYQQEARRLAHLMHKFVVGYVGEFIHQEPSFGRVERQTYFMLLMEFCPLGDLKRLIERRYRALTERRIRRWLFQLVQAVHYLHERNILHRDIKSQNVFLSEDSHIRLGDFGLCRFASPPKVSMQQHSVVKLIDSSTLTQQEEWQQLRLQQLQMQRSADTSPERIDEQQGPSPLAAADAADATSQKQSTGGGFAETGQNSQLQQLQLHHRKVVEAKSGRGGTLWLASTRTLSKVCNVLFYPVSLLLQLIRSSSIGLNLSSRRRSERGRGEWCSRESTCSDGKGSVYTCTRNAATGGGADTPGNSSLLSVAGTDCYMAPEVILGAKYGKPADIWSLGCVMLELCGGVFMWELTSPPSHLLLQDDSPQQQEQLDLLLDSLLPKRVIGCGTKSIIKMLLQKDAAQRPTAAQLMKDKYFRRDYRCCSEPFATSPSLTLQQPEQPGQYPDANLSAPAAAGEKQVELDLSTVEASSWASVYLRKTGVALCGDRELTKSCHSSPSSALPSVHLPAESTEDSLSAADYTSPFAASAAVAPAHITAAMAAAAEAEAIHGVQDKQKSEQRVRQRRKHHRTTAAAAAVAAAAAAAVEETATRRAAAAAAKAAAATVASIPTRFKLLKNRRATADSAAEKAVKATARAAARAAPGLLNSADSRPK